MSHDDVIDHLAEIEPGSALDRIRRARPDAREHAQQAFLALLEPAEPGQLTLAERYAVAAYVALLHDADEVAWNTAVEAAPWLVGTSDPQEAVDPEELYERLEPFKRRVAEDIRNDGGDEA